MKIDLKRLRLTYFKGIRSTSIVFGPVTNIFGDNATGKTTLMDGFLWLLFGKDSTDSKDFSIKTLDATNTPLHKLEHEVEGSLMVNGSEILLRRSFREKWTKKRGSTDSEFTGHETSYFWNDVPMKQEEYQAKIAQLVDEKLFKLITNTTYFNNLKWQDRRAVLLQMAGTISNDDVLDSILNNEGNNPDFIPLINALNANKTIDEFKKEISARKKKFKDELLLFPSRINEATLALPEPKDYSAIEDQVLVVTNDIGDVDSLLSNKSKAEKQYQQQITEKIKEVGKNRTRAQEIEYEEANKVKKASYDRKEVIIEKKALLKSKTDEKLRLLGDYNKDSERVTKLLNEKSEITKRYEAVSKVSLTFNENDFHCPACKRAFDESVIDSKKETLLANFNKDKSDRLQKLLAEGTAIADQITTLKAKCDNTVSKGTSLKTEIEQLQNDIATLEEQHTRLFNDEEQRVKDAIAANTEYAAIQEKIQLLNEEINTPRNADDNSALQQRKRELNLQLDNLKKELSSKEQREKQQLRIKELEDQERTMGQELATLEGVEFSIEKFIKAKIDALEERINGKFKLVRFKMFEEQINGGLAEACTTLMNGVPYPDLNTAGKIQAGLDIINTLSQHYDVQAPVWVDNRESVVRLPETECQLINLIVSEADKKLRVENAGVMSAVA